MCDTRTQTCVPWLAAMVVAAMVAVAMVVVVVVVVVVMVAVRASVRARARVCVGGEGQSKGSRGIGPQRT